MKFLGTSNSASLRIFQGMEVLKNDCYICLYVYVKSQRREGKIVLEFGKSYSQ